MKCLGQSLTQRKGSPNWYTDSEPGPPGRVAGIIPEEPRPGPWPTWLLEPVPNQLRDSGKAGASLFLFCDTGQEMALQFPSKGMRTRWENVLELHWEPSAGGCEPPRWGSLGRFGRCASPRPPPASEAAILLVYWHLCVFQ